MASLVLSPGLCFQICKLKLKCPTPYVLRVLCGTYWLKIFLNEFLYFFTKKHTV